MINLLVVLLKEVVAHSGLYLSHADRPLMKTKFFFDRAHVVDVGALPVTLHVVQEGVLGPSTTVLSVTNNILTIDMYVLCQYTLTIYGFLIIENRKYHQEMEEALPPEIVDGEKKE